MVRSIRNGCRRRIVYTAVVGRTLGKALAAGHSACAGIGYRFGGRVRMRLAHRLGLRYAVGNALGYGIVHRLGVGYTLTLVL